MPSCHALFRASASPLSSSRLSRFAGCLAPLLALACAIILSVPSQAQLLGPAESSAFAATPLAITGMGLISSGDFSLVIKPNEVGASSKLPGTSLMTITPIDGFSQPVSFQCTGLPAGATCAFSPGTVTPAGEPVTDTLTVTYTKPVESLRRTSSPLLPAGVALCALFCCFGLRKHPIALAALLSVAVLSLCTGCGTANSDLKTYQVKLIASSGSQHHSVIFLLTVG